MGNLREESSVGSSEDSRAIAGPLRVEATLALLGEGVFVIG